MARKVERTRNGGKWTEAAYFSAIRSALRAKFRFWGPAIAALKAAERPSRSKNKRLKHEYKCRKCRKWFPRKDVQIDHIVECGSLKSLDDIAGFVQRLTPESPDAFQVLCKTCHNQKSAIARNKRK